MSDDILNTFGSTLSAIRRAKGLSQEKLGEKSNLARRYISNLESGSRNVSILTLQKLAIALEVDVEVLIKPLKKSVSAKPSEPDRKKLAAKIQRIIKTGSTKQVKKLTVFVDEIL